MPTWKITGGYTQHPTTTSEWVTARVAATDQATPIDPTAWPAALAFHPLGERPGTISATVHDAGTPATSTWPDGTFDAGTPSTTTWAATVDTGNPDLDWYPATWDTATRTAAVRVGPTGVQLDPGRYQVWVKVTAPGETPVIAAGVLHLT